MTKKILIFIDDFLPYSNKIAPVMIKDLSKKLIEFGYDILVIYPNNQIDTKFLFNKYENIKTLSFRSGKLKNTNYINRTLNELLISFKLYKNIYPILKKEELHGIIYYSPTIFFGPFIYFLKRKKRIKTYLILRDIFPDWAIDKKLLKSKSIVTLFFKLFEKINYLSADTIGLMSAANLKYFESKKNIKSKKEILYNWLNIVDKKDLISFDFRKKYKIEDKFVFFYGGNIGKAQNIEILLNLAKKFNQNPNVKFVFIGDGDVKELVIEYSKNNENLIYIPYVDQDEYFKIISEFDVGLFSLSKEHKTHNFPGKLLGYMSLYKPIIGIVNDENDLMEIINTNKAGFVFDYDGNELENLYNSGKELETNQTLRDNFGNNSFNLLNEKFSTENAAKTIIKSLN